MARELPKTYDPKEVEAKLYQFWMDGGYFHAEPDAKPAVVFKACSEKIVNIRICIQKKGSLGSVLRDRIPHIHMLRESDVGKSSLQCGFRNVFHGLRTVSGKGRVQMLIS